MVAAAVAPIVRDQSAMSRFAACTLICAILMHMRMHIQLDDEIVKEIDAVAGLRRRSVFVRKAILEALDRDRRTRRLREAAGMFRDSEHEWDDDPAAWVSRQRNSDPRRLG